MTIQENPIYEMLLAALKKGKISDFHLHAGQKVKVRDAGDLVELDFDLSNEMLADFLMRELGTERYEAFDQAVMLILLSPIKASGFVPMVTR